MTFIFLAPKRVARHTSPDHQTLLIDLTDVALDTVASMMKGHKVSYQCALAGPFNDTALPCGQVVERVKR